MAATRDYFKGAIERHGFTGKGQGGNADYLYSQYQKDTKGLDADLAFKALEGGRQFGESDRARYDKLLKERASKQSKAQPQPAPAPKPQPTGTDMSTGNRSTPAKSQPKPKPKLTEYQQSFQDVHDARAPKRQARREAARAGMGDAYKTDINAYDFKSHGMHKFDMKDVDHLRSQGYSDDDIAKYSSNLSVDQLDAQIRLNNTQFAGQHGVKDMAKGAKITDHDVGRGFNVHDVHYLRRQGFSDKEIAAHAHTSVLQGGKSHGLAMANFMHKQGYLDYHHGAWKNAKGKAQAQIKGNNNNNSGNIGVGNTQQNNNSGNIGDGNLQNSQNNNKGVIGSGTQQNNNKGIIGDNNTQLNNSGNVGKDGQGGIGNTNVKDTGDVNNNTELNNQQTQNITQNNDINTTVTGNNNVVTNNQDNSIRNYGGDNRSLIINESNTGVQGGAGRNSRGSYYNTADKAITMGTLGGFFDVDDSPAGQAKFMDMNQTFNRDAQKRYLDFGSNTANRYRNYRSGAFNIENLQKRVDGTGQRFRDMATIQGVKTYGDRAAVTNYPAFEFGDPIKKIESRADKIAKGYKDDIDDV